MSKILLYEPFYKGSHQYFADRLHQYSQHQIELLTQNGVFWKWRFMQSSILGELPPSHHFDIILSTNMVNLASWAGINRKNLGHTKLIHYFHENQFSYPSNDDPENNIYAFMDFTSAVAADQLIFNSKFHQENFIGDIKKFSTKVPQKLPAHLIDLIKQKSHVLPIGIECEQLLENKIQVENEIPIILWNHRHEWDKNPELFFEVLKKVKKQNIPFQLVVLGSSGRNAPAIFTEAKDIFHKEILHWGRVETFSDYAKWLWRADILPVSSSHDFFGISVLEAALCENHLLLPKQNAYPEHFPIDQFSDHYFDSEEELLHKLSELLRSKKFKCEKTSQIPMQYTWEQVIKQYDLFLS